MATPPKEATEHTRRANAARDLGFDPDDFTRATRGLIAQHATGTIEGPFGPAFDVARHDFVGRDDPNPETVNPSLWRQAQLNAVHGLFEVAPGCWQVRGYDISNITFVAGATGWIVIDPLTVEATASAGLALVNHHLGARPVVAVIYTHSHVDHFGGVLGVTSRADVDAGRCRVIAPEHFLREAVSENVIAGPAMARRSVYQFGILLPPGRHGHVDCGLGKAIPLALPGLIAPTEDVTHTGQELVVDGVRIVFQLTPETEAPAEMNFFFPDQGWLCMAENCSHTMHNLVPIRGAQVRDALAWSRYIDEARRLFGRDTEVMFTSHHWPRWGSDDVDQFLRLQRDMYRYIHDQTMRHANHGLTALEIAELIEMPDEYRAHSHTTGYYGHLAHNVKAVFQRYLSWYDANPANLWRRPPSEVGPRYVELAGGAEALLAAARRSFDAGDYRWVAELVNHLIFTDPTHQEARELQADALEQLGYQSESATFRNAFLTGAQELRSGPPPRRDVGQPGMVAAMTIGQLLDAMAVRLVAEQVGGLSAVVHLVCEGEWTVVLSNRAISWCHGFDGEPDAVLRITRSAFESIDLADAECDGDRAAVDAVFGHLDTFQTGFAIPEP
jgi:alkyl sulfatase BDS1-like metallo-beta-lactamase superfamily hydrolase